MKFAGRVASALLFLGIVVGTSYVLKSPEAQVSSTVVETPVGGSSRAPASDRFPASSTGPLLMDFKEPCRSDNECSGNLLCLSGRCDRIDHLNRGHVGDLCSGPTAGPTECLSGRCEQGTCVATLKEKADNGASCNEAAPSVCRSGVCRAGVCVASASFVGVPGTQCATDADCLSGTCIAARDGHKTCGSSSLFAASCQPVGARAAYATECCSGNLDGNGRCQAIPDPDCTQRGNCAARVGRTCADVGQLASSPEQCCTGKRMGGRCVVDLNRKTQPCNLDRACRSGLCDRKTNICDNRYDSAEIMHSPNFKSSPSNGGSPKRPSGTAPSSY